MLFKNNTILITGGSSGIGFDLARLFMAEKAKVILVASNAQKLGQAAADLKKEFQETPFTIAKDLSRPEAPREIFDELHKQGVSIDVLVNNAGFGMFGRYDTVDVNTALGMIAVNVTALAALTRLFVPAMVEKKYGRVLNVASTAGFQGIPKEALYAATKAFVVTFSQGIAHELKGTGVGVTCLCPGATRTPFFERGTIGASHLMKRSMMKSADVARIGFEALKKSKPLVIAGLRNQILIQSERLVPRSIAVTIAGRFVDTKES